MHAELRNQGFKWARNMEGSYISQALLKRYNPQRCWHPALRCDGSFGIDGHASDWIIQRAIIREHGITLHGPAPETLIDPVTPDELTKAAQGILTQWWALLFEDASRIDTSEYQAYAILTMCRCLYTIEKGLVTSKPAAAQWMLDTHGSRWETLIRRALAWRKGDELNAIDETLALSGTPLITLFNKKSPLSIWVWKGTFTFTSVCALFHLILFHFVIQGASGNT